MFTRSLLIFTVTCLIRSNQASSNVRSVPREVLQKFLEIVEENNLNVSIVTSRAKYWTNGKLQDLRANELLLFPNKVHLTKNPLSFKVGQDWVSGLGNWTSQNNGIASFRSISVGSNGKINKKLFKSTAIDQVPLSVSYENILSPNKHDFVAVSDQNWTHVIEYDIHLQNTTDSEIVNVIARNIQVLTIGSSEDMAQADISQMKQILIRVWYLISDPELIAKYLAEYLNTQMHNDQFKWRVLLTTKDYFFSTKKWVTFQIDTAKICIFAW